MRDPIPAHDHRSDCECPRTADLDGPGAAAASRRSFLRTSGLLGAGAGAASLGLLSAPAAAAASAPAGSAGSHAADPYDQTSTTAAPAGRWNPDTERATFRSW